MPSDKNISRPVDRGYIGKRYRIRYYLDVLHDLLRSVMVDFYGYHVSNLTETIFPATPVSKSWEKNVSCRRTHLPLTVAYTATVHKYHRIKLH